MYWSVYMGLKVARTLKKALSLPSNLVKLLPVTCQITSVAGIVVLLNLVN